MNTNLTERCTALVEELGLARAAEITSVEPLTGGVASDIAVVRLGGRRICVKFALPKLKVAADWEAPVHRNAAEYAWLRVAADLASDSAVRLFGRSARAHGFAMEFLEGPEVHLWKARLLEGAGDRGEAAKVADLLGRIHAASAAPSFDRTPFRNRDDFHALRIEPYLTHTATAHPDLAPMIAPLERMLYETDQVLIHGDASPKNILFRDGAPILLDAECATMGDAAFDPAFCLNHLLLKAVHMPQTRAVLLRACCAFWEAYEPHITWEPPDAVEARVTRLLPVLMLARVDGKSPVEYLSDGARRVVRAVSIPLIKDPEARLTDLVSRVELHLKESHS